MHKNNTITDTYRQIIRLTLPIVAQNLLSAAVNSADIVMLNSVGQSAISAVSLATQFSQILFMIFYGLGTGITMLGAQYWGKQDTHAIQIIQAIALRFSVCISVAVFLGTQLLPSVMMRIFTDDAELIALGASYLKTAGFCYLFWSVCEIYLAALRSVGRVLASTILNSIALGLNIILNAVFIYGLFGAPKLGVVGVALATSISRGVELLACLLVSRCSPDVKLPFRELTIRNAVLFQDFIRMALPALVNDMTWGVAFSMYSAILGHLDNDIVAANSIVVVVRNFATVLCFGFGNSCTIWIGRLIGQERLKDARADAGKYMRLTVLTGLIGGGLVLGVSPFVVKYAALTEQALHYLKYMLFINSYYVMGTAVNTTLIAGMFRAGGDSRFGLICDVIDMWLYAVPLGVVAAFVLKLPPLWVYFLLCTDEFVKWPWVIRHYLCFTWLQNVTKDYDSAS